MKIAVITDSSSNLSLEYIEQQKNLKMAPLMISFNLSLFIVLTCFLAMFIAAPLITRSASPL